MKTGKITKIQADLMLAAAALCWGLSFVFSDMCLDHMSPFMLNSYRFCLSFILLCLAFPAQIRTVSRQTVKWSMVCAAPLVLTYVCSTYGVMHTTVSNASFLSGLSGVFTPLIVYIVFKRKPGKKLGLAILMCLIGMALLTLGDDFSINRSTVTGDVISIGCGFFAAANVVAISASLEHEGVDPFDLGIFQLGFVGLFNVIVVAVFGLWAVPPTLKIAGATAFLTVFSTGIAFVLQTVAQKHTEPSHAGIILSLEPVFGALGAVFITGEKLAVRNYVGAAIMLISIIVMELPDRE